MQYTKKKLDTQALMQSYRELLSQVDTLPLDISGNSMSPFLIPDRDSVQICAIRRPLRVGDIVLYQRQNGRYILHRICRCEQNTFTLIGDAHTVPEPGIHRKQIFAIVSQGERNGKKLNRHSFSWWFYEKIWVRIIPLRPYILQAVSVIKKIKRIK